MSENRKNRVLGKQRFFLGLTKVYSSQILCFKKTKTVSKEIDSMIHNIRMRYKQVV